jgi:hypothetical protein
MNGFCSMIVLNIVAFFMLHSILLEVASGVFEEHCNVNIQVLYST